MKHADIVTRLHKLATRIQTDESLARQIHPMELATLHAAADALSWRQFKLPYDRSCISVASATDRVVGSMNNKWYEYSIPRLAKND